MNFRLGGWRPSWKQLSRNKTEQETIDAFIRLYWAYKQSGKGTMPMAWMGYPTLKIPTDLISYQEIITETKPDLIIETGTNHGGSALFFANMCDLLDHGRVVTIDMMDYGNAQPNHPRIEYIKASSTDPRVVAHLAQRVAETESTFVILDSDHSQAHVAAELTAYADFVKPGCYLIVEDTWFNGNPIRPEFGPGPREAVDDFLKARPDFERDPLRERFLLTNLPGGFLRRKRS